MDWKRELILLKGLDLSAEDALREASSIFDKAGMGEISDFLTSLQDGEMSAAQAMVDEKEDELTGLRNVMQKVIREVKPLYPLLKEGDLTHALEEADDDLREAAAAKGETRDSEDVLTPEKTPKAVSPKKQKKGQPAPPPVDLSYDYESAAALFDSEQLTYLFRYDIREGVIRLECAQFTVTDHLALMREDDIHNLVVAALVSDEWRDEALSGIEEAFRADPWDGGDK